MDEPKRQRTCRACGKKFDYPLRGSHATRHHCEDCVQLSPDVRKVLDRLSTRVQMLENTLKRLHEKPPAPPVRDTAP